MPGTQYGSLATGETVVKAAHYPHAKQRASRGCIGQWQVGVTSPSAQTLGLSLGFFSKKIGNYEGAFKSGR